MNIINLYKKCSFILLIIAFSLLFGCSPSDTPPGDDGNLNDHSSYAVTNYGGPNADLATDIVKINENKFFIVGLTVTAAEGNSDGWILEIDSTRDRKWEKIISYSSFDKLYSIASLTTDEYIIVGTSASQVNLQENGIVIKINANRQTIWEKTIGGDKSDELFACESTNDGNVILAGITSSYGDYGYYNGWIIKMNGDGDVLWQQTIGNFGYIRLFSIIQTVDDGYIAVGEDGDKAIIVKLSKNGDKKWIKNINPDNNESIGATSVVYLHDDYYLIVCGGSSGSSGIAPDYETRFIKIDTDGNIIWQKTIDRKNLDLIYKLYRLSDNTIIAVGRNMNNLGGGKAGAWILQLDFEGKILWERTYGESGFMSAHSLAQYKGGYIVVGYSGNADIFNSDLSIMSLYNEK